MHCIPSASCIPALTPEHPESPKLDSNSTKMLFDGFRSETIGVRATGTAGGAASLTQAKPLFFRAKAIFFRQKPASKNEKIFCLHLLNEKTEFILSSEIQCPKSRIFANNYWVG